MEQNGNFHSVHKNEVLVNKWAKLAYILLNHFETQQNVLIEKKKFILSKTEKAEESIKMSNMVKQN